MKAPQHTATPRARKTVLVVDDDPDSIAATCLAIGSEYPVLTAPSGTDALRIARAAHPDLIVLDVMMPGGMDGFTVMLKLRADPATADIPIIIFSDITDTSSLSFTRDVLGQYLGCTPDAVVAKSAPVSALLKTVRHLLGPCVKRPAD